MASSSKLFLHDHPVSSYAQKVRIALREKNIPFDYATPQGLGSGQAIPRLENINPRQEVPALEDGDFKIFDSTVILGYLDDRFVDKPLLTRDPRARAEAKMIEEMCDTHYEAINWAYGEVDWFGRAQGELADKLKRQIRAQAGVIQSWLTEHLGRKDYFAGTEFGYADICVAPIVNRAHDNGYGPGAGSPLAQWLTRIKQRSSVTETFAEYEAGLKRMYTMKEVFAAGGAKREFRDHRLEFMIKSGGIEVVLEGLKKDNIRFSWPSPSAL